VNAMNVARLFVALALLVLAWWLGSLIDGWVAAAAAILPPTAPAPGSAAPAVSTRLDRSVLRFSDGRTSVSRVMTTVTPS